MKLAIFIIVFVVIVGAGLYFYKINHTQVNTAISKEQAIKIATDDNQGFLGTYVNAEFKGSNWYVSARSKSANPPVLFVVDPSGKIIYKNLNTDAQPVPQEFSNTEQSSGKIEYSLNQKPVDRETFERFKNNLTISKEYSEGSVVDTSGGPGNFATGYQRVYTASNSTTGEHFTYSEIKTGTKTKYSIKSVPATNSSNSPQKNLAESKLKMSYGFKFRSDGVVFTLSINGVAVKDHNESNWGEIGSVQSASIPINKYLKTGAGNEILITPVKATSVSASNLSASIVDLNDHNKEIVGGEVVIDEGEQIVKFEVPLNVELVQQKSIFDDSLFQ